MSTVSAASAAQVAQIAAMPPSPDSGVPGYFAQASTRWDLIKFLLPLVLIFVGFLVQQHYDVIGLKEEVTGLRATCAAFQTAKEDRGDRMARLETKIDGHDKSLDELKAGQKDMNDKLDRILERSIK